MRIETRKRVDEVDRLASKRHSKLPCRVAPVAGLLCGGGIGCGVVSKGALATTVTIFDL